MVCFQQLIMMVWFGLFWRRWLEIWFRSCASWKNSNNIRLFQRHDIISDIHITRKIFTFHQDNDPTHYSKFSQNYHKSKEKEYNFGAYDLADSISWLLSHGIIMGWIVYEFKENTQIVRLSFSSVRIIPGKFCYWFFL